MAQPPKRIFKTISNGQKRVAAAAAATAAPTVRDAFTDQHGQRWVRYGSSQSSHVFLLRDFALDERNVIAELINIGVIAPSSAAKKAFKEELGIERPYPPRHVADRNGWATDDCFVFSDGTRATKPGGEPVQLTLTPHARFAARGSLAAWQTGMGSLIAQHPVVATMSAYSLAAPLMRFLPADVTNPIVELSSDPFKGKTTLAIAVAANWGEDPTSSLGMGVSFNATTNALEDRQTEMNDMLLMIDEVNMADTSMRGGESLAEIIFRFERGVGRRRHGDIGGINSRGGRLITANRPLATYITDLHKRAAVESRIVTLVLAPSIFDGLPAGFQSEKEAADHMLAVARTNGGVVGRSFIGRILNRPWKIKGGLRGVASAHMEVAKDDLVEEGIGLASRAQNAFAMMLMTARIATDVGVFKTEWHVANSVIEIARRYARAPIFTTAKPSELASIRAYLIENGFAKPDNSRRGPVSKAALRTSLGVEYTTRAGERMIAIHPDAFRAAFPQEHLKILQASKTAGLAQSENGGHPRLSIKAPSSVCAGERVYSFRVDRVLAS